MRHSFVYASLAALFVTTAACGGANGGGSPASPSPTASSIVISGYSGAITGAAPQTLSLTATANSGTGSTQNVSAEAIWASDTPGVASVTSGGMVTTTGNGSATITAAYGGAVGRITISVNAQSRVVPTMSGSMAISVSPDTAYLYRAQLHLNFTENGGVAAYEVTDILVEWNNAYWEKVLTSTYNASEVASAFGGSNTVAAGGARTMTQEVDYTYTQSGMTAQVTAQVRDSDGNTSTIHGTYGSTLMTVLALKPVVGPGRIVVVRR